MRNDYLPITELRTTAIDNLYNFTIDLRDVTLHVSYLSCGLTTFQGPERGLAVSPQSRIEV